MIDPSSSPALPPSITVRDLLDDPALALDVRLVAGVSGLDRRIEHPRIQKSGLAMVGHVRGLVPTRIQVLGDTELSYAESLDAEGQRRAARHLFSVQLACVFATRGVEPPLAFKEEAELTATPLVVCGQRTSDAINLLHALLDERLAPRTRIHGVLVDVFEVGVLLLGKSGIGKSECALELVMRGHRLVADDVIECDWRPPGMVFGEPAELLRHHIEVRGLGILNILDLYGVTAIRERKRIDLAVRLEPGEADYDRIGTEDRALELLGSRIRETFLPVRPGRNMSAIIEIAARNELLRQAGHDSAREFVARVDAQIAASSDPSPLSDHESERNIAAARPVPPRRGPLRHSSSAALRAIRAEEIARSKPPRVTSPALPRGELESSVPPPVEPRKR
jgi:HPr kinase/phosphorylase